MSIVLVLVALFATGCASIVKGSEQKVSFTSEPSEAKVVITDVRVGKEIQVGSTPFTASLKRGAGYFKKAKYQVTFEKPGYKTEAIT
ncbi:MAG TPA: PEGA domain-containing protein, partial [Methylomirabilota bacterium]|nr:PEGA domain-containing protein [Methylomirabilota bacterium]